MRKIVTTSFLLLILITGCSNSSGISDISGISGVEPNSTAVIEPTSLPGGTTADSTVSRGDVTLTIWIPDDYSNNTNEQIKDLLEDRLNTYEQSNTGINIDLRMKNVKDQENLMDLLNTTSIVAPSILPDIILLTRNDLETGALKGLLVPITPDQNVIPFSQFYSGFETLGNLQGSVFGIPAAGDAMLAISRSGFEGNISTWEEIMEGDFFLEANLNDPNGTLFIALYQSAGGKLTDEKGKPHLDKEALTTFLEFIRIVKTDGSFTNGSLLVSDWNEVAKKFGSGEGDLELNWYSVAKRNGETPLQYQAIPGLIDGSASMVTGWYWAIANPAPERQTATNDLLSFLSQPDFSSTWSSSAGYLPVIDQEWTVSDPNMDDLQVILTKVQPLPETSTSITIGPVIRDSAIRAFSTKDAIEEIVGSALARINQ